MIGRLFRYLFPPRLRDNEIAAAVREGKRIVVQVYNEEQRHALFRYVQSTTPEGWALERRDDFLHSPVGEGKNGCLHAVVRKSDTEGGRARSALDISR